MKSPSTPRVGDGPGTDRSHVADAASLLGALEDDDCRAILEETDTRALSASEISEACEIPLSTAYRKIDTLTEAGLLEEEVRISTGGKHTSEYSLRIDNVHLSLGGDSVELEVTVQREPDQFDSMVAGAD